MILLLELAVEENSKQAEIRSRRRSKLAACGRSNPSSLINRSSFAATSSLTCRPFVSLNSRQLHFDNALSTSVFLLLPRFWLDSLKYCEVDRRLEDRSLAPPMPLSLHIAQGNTRRVAGRKGPAKLPARISVLRPHFGLGLLPEHGARVTNI